MECPTCATPTQVVQTRQGKVGTVKRRRACPQCHTRLTTYEVVGPITLPTTSPGQEPDLAPRGPAVEGGDGVPAPSASSPSSPPAAA